MYIHYVGRLVRKQVYLTAAQDELLKQAAAQERKTEAEVIRSALDQRLVPSVRHDGRHPAIHSGRSWGGRSGGRDVSDQVDHHLYGAPRR